MPAAVLEVFAGAPLAAWLALSLLNQVAGGRWRWFARLTASGFIPNWRFFAPRPGTSDFHVLYRDLLISGEMTQWVEAPAAEARPAVAALWNPGKRPNKALFDLCTVLFETGRGLDHTRLMLSTPYLAILNRVNSMPASSLAACRQFVLMATYPDRPQSEAEPLFVSGFHEL